MKRHNRTTLSRLPFGMVAGGMTHNRTTTPSRLPFGMVAGGMTHNRTTTPSRLPFGMVAGGMTHTGHVDRYTDVRFTPAVLSMAPCAPPAQAAQCVHRLFLADPSWPLASCPHKPRGSLDGGRGGGGGREGVTRERKGGIG